MDRQDYAMLVAMSLSLCGMGIVIPQVMNGAGRHAAYLDPEVNKLGLKVTHDPAPIPSPPLPAAGRRRTRRKRKKKEDAAQTC